jgi:hypothetical protein
VHIGAAFLAAATFTLPTLLTHSVLVALVVAAALNLYVGCRTYPADVAAAIADKSAPSHCPSCGPHAADVGILVTVGSSANME